MKAATQSSNLHDTIMAHSSKQKRNSVRIIAGDYRSRKLDFPSLVGLRPTADRVRETLFNWTQDSIQGELCLDLFAGSGALGFEALSRKAGRVDFVEKSNEAARAISANIERLGAERATVVCADAFTWLKECDQDRGQYGMVFLDPPFHKGMLANAAELLDQAKVMRDGCLVYVEQAESLDSLTLPANWDPVKDKKAGSVHFGLYKVTTEY